MKQLYAKLKDEVKDLSFTMERESLLECCNTAAFEVDFFSIGRQFGHIKLKDFQETFNLLYFNVYEDIECTKQYNILQDAEINPFLHMK